MIWKTFIARCLIRFSVLWLTLPVMVTTAFYSEAIFWMLQLFYTAVPPSTQLSESARQGITWYGLFCVPNRTMEFFFAQMLAVVRSFMFTYDLACTYILSTSQTCSQTKPVHIWRSFNVEGMSGGKYSITWGGAGGKFAPSRGQFFLIFMTNTCTYMCSHTCRHTHSVSPEPTGNKAGKNITLVYSTLAGVIFS